MEDKNTNALYCSRCGALIGEDEDYGEVNGEIVCNDCIERYTSTCDRCGETIWTDDSYGDEYTTLCHHCYENHYTRCSCCDALLHEDDTYHLDGYDYCSECYLKRTLVIPAVVCLSKETYLYSVSNHAKNQRWMNVPKN